MSFESKNKNSKNEVVDEYNYLNNDEYMYESASTSKRYKRNINRLFRNNIKSKNIPYPEVDNVFYRITDKLLFLISHKKN